MTKCVYLVLSLLLSQINSSNAFSLYGGQEALGDERVVYVDVHPNISGGGCTGALIEPRMVFTAGHCLNAYWGDKSKTKYVSQVEIEPMLVYEPGAIASWSSNFKYAQVTAAFRSTKYVPSDDKNGPQYDFAVLILDKPLGTKTFEIANQEKIKEFVDSSKSVTSIGYGYSSWQDFQNYQNGKGKDPKPHKQSVILRKELIQTTNKTAISNYDIVQTLMPFDSYNCSGDSGGPLWLQDGDNWLYIGALSGAMGGSCTSSPNDPLWKDEFWSKNRGSTYWTAQAFPDVILDAKSNLETVLKAEAESAISKAEAAKKKSTITCVKGKKTKKVTAIKPKCPKGYKKV